MAECFTCQKKLGFIGGVPVELENHRKYLVCDSCHKKMNRFLNEDESIYKEMLGNCITDEAKQYISNRWNKAKAFNEIKKVEVQLKEKNERDRQEQIIINEEKEREKRQIISKMIVTTSFHVEGFHIKEYRGLISGETVMGTGFASEINASVADFLGSNSLSFSRKLKEAKQQAVYRLKEDCYTQGGNAIIGISFHYVTFANNMIGVVANGTAVSIE